MPITPADVTTLEKRIEGDIEDQRARLVELEAELKAVRLLKKRVQAEQSGVQLPLEVPTAVTAGAPIVSFAESVRRAVAAFKDELFTVRDVENMLRSMNAPLPKNNLRTRIAVEVKDLLRKKQLVLVEKGTGHNPHKYRRTVRATEDTQKSERALVIQPRAPSVQH